MIKINIKYIFVGALIVAGAGIGLRLYPNKTDKLVIADKQSASVAVNKISIISASYAADFTDDKILIGASHNVFTGKVIKQVGNKERNGSPETQFEVDVISNIKGNLEGTVVVDQEGGYKNGILYVMDGGENGDVLLPGNDSNYLLQPGSTYLFATRYNQQENWYTLGSFYTARKLISKNKDLDKNNLLSLVSKDERVKQLRKAYPDEVLLNADIQNNNVRNNFKSLPPEEQERIKNEVKNN